MSKSAKVVLGRVLIKLAGLITLSVSISPSGFLLIDFQEITALDRPAESLIIGSRTGNKVLDARLRVRKGTRGRL